MVRTSICVSAVCLLICQQASAIDKGALLANYRDKFVVVNKEGLSTYLHQGLASGTLRMLVNDAGQLGPPKLIGGGTNGGNASSFSSGPASPAARLNAPWVASSGRGYVLPGCGVVQIREGGVVKVSHVSLSGRLLEIDLTVSPQAVKCTGWTEPPGPSAPAVEMGSTELAIQASQGAGLDIDALAARAVQWLTPLATVADVEQALGAPQKRVDSGDKVLYQYKDMAVEFKDGKVTGVR